ncbi:universal stress protein [Arthrobacter sp. AL08]|uniref:universal stress protein n=1 Tax=Micrococcaceae TaxID=1268 RepID=UPI001CFF8860|nr:MULTISPECIES: universal stress protein [Micrococcaceae]MCB5282844.1 Universal stress protein [Arthrobacter sp. ES1]MDD1476527.1 universal stress protein [Arthrobacter sp. H16F315]MDI3240175.1 universal stress protein [Arthrobacter sp. AL05]MDI3276185.1 universal stress protein [Arthrobacter sp. AL08]MDJ0353809.1 universal stress protein [Pseudarthrobacter sp. PH31-O2]
MNGDQRVVVGVDGSDFSTAALRLAGRMARGLDAPLAVVTCLGTSDLFLASHLPEESSPTTTQLEETAKRLVDEALERAFGTDLPEGLSRTVKFGAPAKVLVAESRNAQLLVVGRRGRGGFLAQVMGSVSGACAAHAHCPVLVVGQDPDKDQAGR